MYGFEICEEDVYIALQEMGVTEVERFQNIAEDIVIDHSSRVEDAALAGDDMDEQCEYAIKEIKKIIKEDHSDIL